MCGIVGIVDWSGKHPPDQSLLRRMLGVIRHRGPDEFGLYLDRMAGIGCARLSIVDLSTGQQPIANADGSLWIVFNGEVYNYPELRAGLQRKGHRFTTRSDTEVVLHMYESEGPACLEQLNGQFAIAIWDSRKRELFLARDRLGIRPLFYTLLPSGLLFSSEIKSLLLDQRVQTALDPYALAQALNLWAPLAPRTIFRGILQLPPGHYMTVSSESSSLVRYWSLSFPSAGREEVSSEGEAAEQLEELLSDATRLRLRADVTVGGYVSGGLDSTLVAALIRQNSPEALYTFSIAFEDPAFDERAYQETATAFLGTEHRRTEGTNADIGLVFPQVVWHAEAPLLRTSPAPMYLLSRLVHENDIKVVLTGEGADELLGGYNIFKEDKVRRFWARQSDSTCRPLLLRRLYPYVTDLSRGGDAYLAAFFRRGLTDVSRTGYSHHLRWRNGARLLRLLSASVRATLREYDPVEELLSRLDGSMSKWSPLAQAQYLEVTTFMSPYLLSSQGDRMMAANSVEGRYPFLDHRVVEFCGRLPPHRKIWGLQEKHILKQSARDLLPEEVWRRRKQPYRAPIRSAFFTRPLDYVDDLLSPESVGAGGHFDPDAVGRLVKKCRAAQRVSENDEMALVGVLSTQLLQRMFLDDFPRQSVQEADPVSIFRRKEQ